MYDCSTIMKLVHAHLDGELDVKESLRVEAHLQECSYCRENFLAEKAFQSLVQRNRPVSPAPEFTARCLQAALDREVRHRVRARHSRSLPWIAAALFLVAAAAVFVALGDSNPRVPRLVKLAVDAHTTYLRDPASLDITSDDGAVVSAWLEERLHFPVGIPKTAMSELKLVGGSVLADAQTPTAYLAYRSEGETVSLLITPPQETRLNGRDVISFRNILFHPADVSGYHTLEWSDSGHTYVLVSTSPRAVNRGCGICHGSEAERNLLGGFTSGV
jgi:anti-sigma factor RsiW